VTASEVSFIVGRYSENEFGETSNFDKTHGRFMVHIERLIYALAKTKPFYGSK
jgi:hypothetical protein